ncbi:MAG TPA: undecaprenyl-phosphate glucose phosphotransferase [Gammaproteobacteria bacterium]|nr:undecaprenyl-phosphate glucose phosphotransferase [Gammaproteobacteria bacterium]
MQKLTSRTTIMNAQEPLALIARVVDSLGIGLALYLCTTFVDTVEGWSRVHAFYALLAILLMQFYAEFFHVYQNWVIKNTFWSRFWMLALSSSAWAVTGLTLLIIALIFDQQPEQLDWKLASYWFGLTILMFAIIRLVINAMIRLARLAGFNVRKVAIAGAGPIGHYVKEQIEDNPWIGYELVGIFDDRSHKEHQIEKIINRRKREAVGDLHKGLPVGGNFKQLIEDALAKKFDAVFISLPMRAEHKTHEIIRRLSNTTVAVYVIPDFYSIETHFTHMVNINGMPAVSVYENPVSGLSAIVKRIEDVTLSLLIMSLILVPMVLIAIAVKLTSRGPVIFKQLRYGLDLKPIKVWKFRTMRVMENGNDFKQATKNDPRITRLGRVLRKYSLDELPQFINVLSGSMSIVGPRPHAVAHNEAYRNIIRGYMLRHKTKPGITGWAQVNGFRGETDSLDKMQGRVMYDIDYIRKWSIFLDLKIIIMTVFKGFSGKHVY